MEEQHRTLLQRQQEAKEQANALFRERRLADQHAAKRSNAAANGTQTEEDQAKEAARMAKALPRIIAVLAMNPGARSVEDKQYLFTHLRPWQKAFGKWSDFVLSEIVGVASLQRIEKDRVICRQGDIGTIFYVILMGSVSVQLSKTGRIEDSVPVAKIPSGCGFGDLALISDNSKRAATIVTLEDCFLMCVEKVDYTRVVKVIFEKDAEERALFLRKIAIFKTWSPVTLKAMTQVVSTRTEPPGTVLQEEGKLGKELFMIRKGKVHVQLWSQRHQRAVRVLTLGPLDYFNHNMVLDVEATASATFVVDEAEPAVVLVMTMYDARSKCLTGIPEDAPNYGWTASQIDAAYATQVEQKHWLALRQKEFHERAKRKAIAQPIHG